MLELIAFIIFTCSVIVLTFVVVRKIPVLTTLPQNGHHGFKKHAKIVKIEKKIKDIHFHFFEKQMLLHKILSKFRLLVLRTERRIDTLLQSIRKKAQELDNQTKKKK